MMLIAIASDIHDNIWNLDRVLADIRTRKAEALLFLGDFCAPFTLAQIAEGFGGPVHAVFGNNDGDPFLLSTVARKYAHVTLHGQLAELELDGKRVAINHYPKIAIRLAESGAYAAVFSGHDHQAMVQRVGTTLWANPGEVMGRFGAPSYGIYDTGADRFEHVSLAAR
jgi:putative phosphoesterase